MNPRYACAGAMNAGKNCESKPQKRDPEKLHQLIKETNGFLRAKQQCLNRNPHPKILRLAACRRPRNTLPVPPSLTTRRNYSLLVI